MGHAFVLASLSVEIIGVAGVCGRSWPVTFVGEFDLEDATELELEDEEHEAKMDLGEVLVANNISWSKSLGFLAL